MVVKVGLLAAATLGKVTVIVSLFEALPLSCTLNVTLAPVILEVVGAPETVELVKVNPGGKDPDDTVYVAVAGASLI